MRDFVYENGTFTTLNVAGGVSKGRVAINDPGEVAGAYCPAFRASVAPWSANGPGMTDQARAAGARFASFGRRASDQPPPPASLHGNGISPGPG